MHGCSSNFIHLEYTDFLLHPCSSVSKPDYQLYISVTHSAFTVNNQLGVCINEVLEDSPVQHCNTANCAFVLFIAMSATPAVGDKVFCKTCSVLQHIAVWCDQRVCP
jgi:hypothetical protein